MTIQGKKQKNSNSSANGQLLPSVSIAKRLPEQTELLQSAPGLYPGRH